MEALLSRTAKDAKEARRLRAYELFQGGWKQSAIAEALGVTSGAVSQWLKRAAQGGAEALRALPVPGAPRKLKREDLAKLPALLSQGAEAFGFRGAVWTRKRVADLIQAQFGVRYTPQRIGSLLREIGWSRQKPQRKARQQDAQPARRPSRRDLPPRNVAEDKKGALKEGRTALLADETGIYLLPMAVSTWAPIGQTPILEETLTRDHLSLMAAVTPDGKLYSRTQDHAFNGASVADFLRQLLRRIPGEITLVWDGSPIHRSKEVQALLSERAAKRLHLVFLPPYAPELNPTEGLWSYLKRVELANIASHDLSELRHRLHNALTRLRRLPDLLRSFFLPLDSFTSFFSSQ